MSTPPECTEFECWQVSLDLASPSEQRERFERHLEACPACQGRLDCAEEGEDTFRRVGRRVGDPTVAPADPTLTEVLARLHEGKSADRITPSEPADLYFLRPAGRPGILGTLGPYEVREVIGQGGMGVVLKAFDLELHRQVAIKVLAAAVAGSATARRRFSREAQAAAAVCHDHVVTVHGVHEADGLPYLVMQYVAGESLQDRLDRVGQLEVVEVVRIGMQTAAGLAAAHAQGLIHRDIKPANLLLEERFTAENTENAERKPEGNQSFVSSSAVSAFSAVKSSRVKITDFGLARMADDVGLTQSGVVAGTPEYMAPEQARGEPVDHRADLFSLGSVLYTMCTGVPPFRGSSAVAVLRQVSDLVPRPIRALNPEVPVWLETLVARLMAKAPADRFQSAAEVAALLEGYLAHLREPATVSAPILPSHSASGGRGLLKLGPRPHLWLPALVFLAILGLSFSAWFAGGAGEQGARKDSFQEYYHSFKDNPNDRQDLELIGPDAEECVTFEPAGLRITLPAGYAGPPGFHGERPDTGVAIPVGVKGDFEITVRFEILQEPEPEDAGWPGTRLTLDAGVDRGKNTVTTLSRRVEKTGGPSFLAWMIRWDEDAGKHETQFKGFRTRTMAGGLRLARTGSVVSYWTAEGPNNAFNRLQEYPFTGEDLQDVRVSASTGKGPNASLVARVTDVRIRGAALTKTNGPEAGPPKIENKNKGWFAIVLASSLALMLALGVVIAVVRGRAAGKMPAPPAVGIGGSPVPLGGGTGEPPVPTVAAPFVVFPCSSCGKGLKAKAELAGKKLKCPKCGQAALVPRTETAD